VNPQEQSQSARRKKLGEILIEAKVVDEFQVGTALGHQRQWGGRLGNILIDLHFIDDATLASTLAQQLGLRLIDLSSEKIDLEVVRLVPQSLAERHNAFPVHYDPKSRESLTVAFSDPTNLAAIDEVRFQTGKTLRIVVAPEGQISQAIRRFYGGEEPTLTDRAVGEPPGELAGNPADEPSGLFGSVNEFLAAPEEDELAELEPIPSDSQISLNIRDLGLIPQPLPEAQGAAKAQTSDPLLGFFQGAPIPRSQVPVAQSPGTGLPEAFRSAPFLGSPPVTGPPGGVPPVLARAGAGSPASERPEGEAPPRRESTDIFAQAVDLSKKTVEGFIPPQDLLRSHSSTSIPVASSAFASPPAVLSENAPATGPVPERSAAPPQWELRKSTGVIPAFTESDLGGALGSLEQPVGAGVAPSGAAPASVPVALAASETRFAKALARLLIEKGLIHESELLAKLAEE
jgi:hypothetical protein